MLEKLNLSAPKRPCKVRTLYESLDEADKEILLKNMSDRSIPSKRLESAFAEIGIQLGDTAINHHRSGNCSCSRI